MTYMSIDFKPVKNKVIAKILSKIISLRNTICKNVKCEKCTVNKANCILNSTEFLCFKCLKRVP